MQKTSMIQGQLLPMAFPEWVITEIERAQWENCYSKGNSHLTFSDIGMPISKSRNTLTPIEIARVLAELKPICTDNVLEIGSSVMRLTSIFARICCAVYNLEHDLTRYNEDVQIVDKLGLRNVTCIPGENLDALEGQKYSLIMVNYPMDEMDQNIVNLLLDGGRMCAIIGRKVPQKIMLYTKHQSGVNAKVISETTMLHNSNDKFCL